MVTAGRELTLIVAGDPDQRTGGYLYDARIADGLRGLGWRVRVVGLAGRFPVPDDIARDAMEGTLSGLSDGARVVIDGLAMGAMPDVVQSHAGRLDLTALVHHPLADETGIDPGTQARLLESEARALEPVQRVIVTSAFTARRLGAFGVPAGRIYVVEPGVDPAPPAADAAEVVAGRSRQRFLCVASLTPRKGHPVLIQALAGMTDRRWYCECAGGAGHDPEHAAALYAVSREPGLDDRLRWLGELDAGRLSQAYERADVLVLPSHYEGFGMVVLEALARGLPVIATDGGALADTVPREAGIVVPAGDSDALRGALTAWCDNPDLRLRLSRGARRVRLRLADWTRAAAAFADALEGRSAPVPLEVRS